MKKYKKAMDEQNPSKKSLQNLYNLYEEPAANKTRFFNPKKIKIVLCCLLCVVIIGGVFAIPLENNYFPNSTSGPFIEKFPNLPSEPLKPVINSFISAEDFKNNIQLYSKFTDRLRDFTNGYLYAEDALEEPWYNLDSGNKGEMVDFSKTNVQVENVDEDDIVKTNGKIIAEAFTAGTVNIIDAKNGKTEIAANISVKPSLLPLNIADKNAEFYVAFQTLYLIDDTLYILFSGYFKNDTISSVVTCVQEYDVSNPAKPIMLNETLQNGQLSSSRLSGGTLYLITSPAYYTYWGCFDEAAAAQKAEFNKENLLPWYNNNGTLAYINPDNILSAGKDEIYGFSSVSSYDLKNRTFTSSYAIAENIYVMYMTTESLYVSIYEAYSKSHIYKFNIDDGYVTLYADANISGVPFNQFSFDEKNNHLRIVLTEHSNEPNRRSTSVAVFDSKLNLTGKISGIAEGEQLKSIRYDGDIVYFVTFLQVDPLFAADLSDPSNPVLLGELKIPGYSAYMHILGDNLVLGIGADGDDNRLTGLTKLSLFDVSDPLNMVEHKKLIVNYAYSEAMYNHKSVFIDTEKKLFGFYGSSYEYFPDTDKRKSGYKNGFSLYSYDREFGITEVLNTSGLDLLSNEGKSNHGRGLYIGDYFYVIDFSMILSFDMNDGFKLNSSAALQ
ncbi:beta-propeller domain-containing protein [Eubacteriales bacterium OttesenSCG-928-G02]|nr:beta-propeller domain-containing protein [Eubacteriales bacterium OttesenSCG-928-G02]